VTLENLPLSSGGFGVVYRGRWNGKTVAIKMILLCNNSQPGHGNGERVKIERRIAFDKEANLLHSMAHPNIVKVIMESMHFVEDSV
jgi:serine/threonine protein kinase